MLEGLDTIKWEDYHGAYSGQTELPKMIRALLSEDAETRDEAQGFIWGELTHQGTIYSSAIVTIPFLLKILESNDSPDPYAILELLYQLVRDIRASIRVESFLEYGDFDVNFQTYQLIADGYKIYRQHLNHASAKVRILAIKLLMLKGVYAASSRVALRQRLKKEKSALIRAILLNELSRLVKYIWDGGWERALTNGYRAIFLQHLGTEHERLVRLVAATHFNPNYADHQISKQVLDILFDALKMPVNPQDFADFELYGDELKCAEPYAVLEKIGAFGVSMVAPRLNDRTLSPLHVHYLGRELLDGVFERLSRAAMYPSPFFRWGRLDGWIGSHSHPPYRSTSQNLPMSIYSVERIEYISSQEYFPGKDLSKKQKLVIEALVNCDAFWEIKSNLFSYVYGLPDEREALRRLL